MANHLNKFMPNLVDTTKSLCDLLVKNHHWTWTEPQQMAFAKVKEQLSSSPVLTIYDFKKETTIAADESSYGLGAVLTQIKSDGSCRPMAYAS